MNELILVLLIIMLGIAMSIGVEILMKGIFK